MLSEDWIGMEWDGMDQKRGEIKEVDNKILQGKKRYMNEVEYGG